MRRLVTATLVFFVSSAPAFATASVTYGRASEVSPLIWRSANERDALFAHLARMLTTLGKRDLPEGRKLDVRLLEVRPAGQFEPWRPGADAVRTLRDTTPPSVKLSYRLTERGRTLAQGEETVTDLNYLSDVSSRTSLGSFPYETELMRDWFRDRIVRLKPPPS